MTDGSDRGRLRHAPALEEPQPVTFLEPLHERAGQRGSTAHDEPQRRDVQLVVVAVPQQVGPHRGHRGRDRRPLRGDELGERLGLQEPVGHQQRRTGQEGGVGHAPGIGVELRDDGEHADRASSPITVGVHAVIECRYVERCEYTTPFGSPVVPLV